MNAQQTTKTRRVVAKLPAALYVRLYAHKLRTGRSLEKLLEEAVTLLLEKPRDVDSNSPST